MSSFFIADCAADAETHGRSRGTQTRDQRRILDGGQPGSGPPDDFRVSTTREERKVHALFRR